ncbi:MAG: winged helix-turn-helix domain-containing protein [Methylococcaceae bacterium]
MLTSDREAQRTTLKTHVAAQGYLTSQGVCDYLKRIFRTVYTPNAMTKRLKQWGFSYKKPKRFPAKADRAVQEAFLKETLELLVTEASNDTPLYFMDAVHAHHTTAYPPMVGFSKVKIPC